MNTEVEENIRNAQREGGVYFLGYKIKSSSSWFPGTELVNGEQNREGLWSYGTHYLEREIINTGSV